MDDLRISNEWHFQGIFPRRKNYFDCRGTIFTFVSASSGSMGVFRGWVVLRWAKSPIASVQRTRSTLAGHSAVPCGTNVKQMHANFRAVPILKLGPRLVGSAM